MCSGFIRMDLYVSLVLIYSFFSKFLLSKNMFSLILEVSQAAL